MPFQVRYMKIIEKSGYQALPWVRYITQSGGKAAGTLGQQGQGDEGMVSGLWLYLGLENSETQLRAHPIFVTMLP